MRLTQYLCLLMLLCCGCMRTAVVKFWEPAEIDVSHLNRIMVLEFTGDQGKSIATSLSGRLWQNEFYTVIDRTELTHELQLANYVQNNPNAVNDVLKRARSKGVDGVVMGEVIEYRCEDHHVRRARLRPSQDEELEDLGGSQHGRLGIEIREEVVREGTVTIAFRLVDVESGEVRAAREVTRVFQSEVDQPGEDIPSKEIVLSNLTQECLTEIVGMLAPHEATSQIQLAACDIWTRGRREVKEGLLFAENGQWTEAEKSWQAALKANPNNHAALFNLSVVADRGHEYTEAEEYAMQAIRIQHKPCYAMGLDTIRTHKAAAEKAEDQRDARVATVVEETWR